MNALKAPSLNVYLPPPGWKDRPLTRFNVGSRQPPAPIALWSRRRHTAVAQEDHEWDPRAETAGIWRMSGDKLVSMGRRQQRRVCLRARLAAVYRRLSRRGHDRRRDRCAHRSQGAYNARMEANGFVAAETPRAPADDRGRRREFTHPRCLTCRKTRTQHFRS